MAYKVVILPSAISDLEKLSLPLKTKLLRKIKWLGENSEYIIHYRLKNMPSDLEGLCRIHFASYRITYGVLREKKVSKIYLVGDRKEIYRRFLSW